MTPVTVYDLLSDVVFLLVFVYPLTFLFQIQKGKPAHKKQSPNSLNQFSFAPKIFLWLHLSLDTKIDL